MIDDNIFHQQCQHHWSLRTEKFNLQFSTTRIRFKYISSVVKMLAIFISFFLITLKNLDMIFYLDRVHLIHPDLVDHCSFLKVDNKLGERGLQW